MAACEGRRLRESRAFPIVVSGPSGAGKTTLTLELTRRDPMLKASVSVTTRPPREGEVDGESYRFIDEAKFEELKKTSLIEWASVHGRFYGTPRDFVEQEIAKGLDVVLNIDVQGGAQVKKAFPNAVLIFILPPSYEELQKRIMQRGTDYAAEITKRMENARREIKVAADYDYLVINDQLEDAVSTLAAIVVSERCRRVRYPKTFLNGFAPK
jgi:guanylate kinase